MSIGDEELLADYYAETVTLKARISQLERALERIRDTDLLMLFPIVDCEDGLNHTLAQRNARFGFEAARRMAADALRPASGPTGRGGASVEEEA